MKNKSIVQMSLIVFALILTFNLNALAQKTDCSQTTDEDVIKAVYEKLKDKYPKEVSHINVRATAGIVTLEGWVTSEKIKEKVKEIAEKVDCVKQVVNDLTVGKSGGCGPGQKECGGACISEKEPCNVCLADPLNPGCVQQNPKDKEPKKPEDPKDEESKIPEN